MEGTQTLVGINTTAVSALIGILLVACSSQGSSSQPSQAQKLPSKNSSKVLVPGEIERVPNDSPSVDGPSVIPADAAGDQCLHALSLAARTLKHEGKAMDASFFQLAPSVDPFDFNRDGVTDCVLSWSSQNYIFIRQPSEAPSYRYAGMVIADTEFGSVRIYCSTTMIQGLCELSGAQRMIHGETQTRSYQFDGSEYREVSVRLSAPHPKFGP